MKRINTSSPAGPAAGLAVALLALACATFGCNQSAGLPTAAIQSEPRSAADILERMAEVYRSANNYADAGELRIIPAEAREDAPLPFAVSFERPQKVRIDALRAGVVADGQTLRAIVHALPGQALVRPCPDRLQLTDFSSDQMLDQAMRGQLEADLPQLVLLVDDYAITKLLGEAQPVRLSDADFQGEKCYRVAASGSRGRSVFWISPTTFMLRKFEFPIDTIKDRFRLAAVVAEFKGARINQAVNPLAFKMALPAEVKQLKRFLEPPPEAPEAPSPLLGKTAGDFAFLDMKGGTVTRESLQGKVVVLDLWATWCGWCFEGFPNLQKVYDQYAGNDKVAILTVNRDEATVADAAVRKAFENAKVKLPIVRDQQMATDKVFEVKGLPTMIILGPDGTIQDMHVGYDANLAETLPKKLDQLLAGESIVQGALDQYAQEKAQYDEQLKKYEELVAESLADGQSSAPASAGEGASLQ